MNKLQSIIRSFTSLPLWVQVWVALLVLVNAACLAFLDTPTGLATAVAGAFVLVTNTPLMIWYGGMNRALSIPHLFAWIPLSMFLVQHLWIQSEQPIGAAEFQYALAVLIVNAISLAFDLLDSWRWLRGERETPGLS